MKRKVEEIDTSSLKHEFPELKDSKVEIFIDAENQKEKRKIEELLIQAGRKKLNTIFGCILRGVYINGIYKKEGKGITAIKLTSGGSKNQNCRIYCKEFYKNGKKVVMVTPFIKKVQKNQKSEKIINIIKKINKLQY